MVEDLINIARIKVPPYTGVYLAGILYVMSSAVSICSRPFLSIAHNHIGYGDLAEAISITLVRPVPADDRNAPQRRYC